MTQKDVVTKANLQYYDGKIKREIAKKGDTKGIKGVGLYTRHNASTGITRIFQDSGDGDGNVRPLLDVTDTGVSVWNHNQDTGFSITNGTHDVTITTRDTASSAGMNEIATIPTKEYFDDIVSVVSGLKMEMVPDGIFESVTQFESMTSMDDITEMSQGSFLERALQNPNVIYLFKVGVDEYNEYVLTDVDTTNETFKWEYVGHTKQDLTGYVKDEEVQAIDNDYIDYVVDYKYMAEGLYDALGNKVSSGGTIIDSSLSAEPIFVANPMMTQVITGVNDAFDPGTNVKTLIVDRNETYAVDGENFEGMRNLPRIETLVIKCGMTFAGDCFSGCTDLKRIYVYSGANLTEANLGNCTAKIIYVDP